jgi:parafibromin
MASSENLASNLASRTTMLLEGTTIYFDRVQRERNNRHRSYLAATPHSPATPSSRSRHSFGLAPWHRRNSHDSFLSVSSSVHRLLMGKTPSSTPNPEGKKQGQYSGQDGKMYMKGKAQSHVCQSCASAAD